MNQHDLWYLPNTMEAFGICVSGLASATPLLVHSSAATPAEVMDFVRKLAEFYELYDRRVSVASLVGIYKDHVTAQFTQLRTCALKNDSELPRGLRSPR